MDLNDLIKKVKGKDNKIIKSYLKANFSLDEIRSYNDILLERIKKEKNYLTNEEILKELGIKFYYSQVSKAPYKLFANLVNKFLD